MGKDWNIYVDWNPWHGCTKISPGCKFCYVYRQDEMYGSEIASSLARKTLAFNLPVKRGRDRNYKIPSGKIVFTCFTSDFLLKDADAWRPECWKMMRLRNDCMFYFFTKRIDRLAECLPPDWGDGYDNVIVGCTVENQAMADYRLPIFKSLPIRHKSIVVAPMLNGWMFPGGLTETSRKSASAVSQVSGQDPVTTTGSWTCARNASPKVSRSVSTRPVPTSSKTAECTAFPAASN